MDKKLLGLLDKHKEYIFRNSSQTAMYCWDRIDDICKDVEVRVDEDIVGIGYRAEFVLPHVEEDADYYYLFIDNGLANRQFRINKNDETIEYV